MLEDQGNALSDGIVLKIIWHPLAPNIVLRTARAPTIRTIYIAPIMIGHTNSDSTSRKLAVSTCEKL